MFGNALDYNLKITVFDKDGKQLADYPAGIVPKEKFGRSFELLPSPDGQLLALYAGSRVSFTCPGLGRPWFMPARTSRVQKSGSP